MDLVPQRRSSDSSTSPRLLGIDTGGTFTDFVFWDGKVIHTHKVLSTPQAPQDAVMQGIRELSDLLPTGDVPERKLETYLVDMRKKLGIAIRNRFRRKSKKSPERHEPAAAA